MGFASWGPPYPGGSLLQVNGIPLKGFPLSTANGIRFKGVPFSKANGIRFKGIPLSNANESCLKGFPPLHCEWDSLQGGPLLQSECYSLQGIPPLHRDSVSLQGTLLHLDIRGDKEADESSLTAPVKAMIDFILTSFPDAQESPYHPSSRSFDLSPYAGVTDTAIPSGSLLAYCLTMSDAFSDAQQRFAYRIKDGRVCHTLLATLNKFEKVSNSPTQRSELMTNPNILGLFWNRIPNISHVPMSLKEIVAVEQSLTSGLESHNFLT